MKEIKQREGKKKEDEGGEKVGGDSEGEEGWLEGQEKEESDGKDGTDVRGCSWIVGAEGRKKEDLGAL